MEALVTDTIIYMHTTKRTRQQIQCSSSPKIDFNKNTFQRVKSTMLIPFPAFQDTLLL